MKNDQILAQISEFCRRSDMAESTFGRRAVNDGKLVHRLREGKRITIDTLERIQAYIAASTPGGLPPVRGLEVVAVAEPRYGTEGVTEVADVDAAADLVAELGLGEGDAVLVKASRSARLERVVARLRAG